MSGSTTTPAQPQSGGMRRIPFPSESYQHPSLPLANKRLLNYYAEQQPADARAPFALIPTPGLDPWFTAGVGPIWPSTTRKVFGGISSVAHEFYRYTSPAPPAAPNLELLGSIGTPSVEGRFDYLNMITVASGPTAAVAVVPPNGWVINHTTSVVNQIGTTWPEDGASSVTYIDGYFVFTSPSFGFFISKLSDPTSFDALDFASNEGGGDVRVMTLNGELWFGSAGGMEVWYNSGDADFPFRPRRSARINIGVGSPQSMAIGDRSLIWLGIDGIVYRSQGYRAQRISNHWVETITADSGTLVESSLCTTHRGHIFYVINFPDRSLCCDLSNMQWHELASSADGSGRWRGNATASIEIDTGVVGDRLSGTLFTQRANLGTENGIAVQRQLITPPIWADSVRAFANRLEIEMDSGTPSAPGSLVLDWSDDGGNTWNGGPRTLNTGADFNHRRRVFTTRMGSFRQRVYRLTSNGPATLYGIDADISGGTW
jgi:hypothetical protein